MKEKISRIIQLSKLKNIFILSSGVLFAQIIGFITQPIATRLYSPEMFGKLAIITSITTMFYPVLSLKYDQLIVIVKSDYEANVLTVLSLKLVTMISIIYAIGLIFYNFFFPSTFYEVGYWIYFSIPLISISAFVSIVTVYNNRFEQYKLMASVTILRAVVSNALKITLGVFKAGFVGLLLPSFVSSVFGIKRQAKYLSQNFNKLKQIKKDEILRIAKRHKNQPLYSAPGFFVNNYSYSVLPILILGLYGVEETGYFSQSMLLLGLPLSLISVSASQVFFRNASKERSETGSFYSSFKNTTLLLGILSIIPFTVLWFYAEELFSIVFGEEWFRSGTFVKLLIPMYFVRFTVTALTEALIIVEKQKTKLIIQFLFVIMVTFAYFISNIYSLSIEVFLTLVNYMYLLNYLLIFLIVFRESKKIYRIH